MFMRKPHIARHTGWIGCDAKTGIVAQGIGEGGGGGATLDRFNTAIGLPGYSSKPSFRNLLLKAPVRETLMR